MNAHPLDRAIWHALSTRQSAFALGGDKALRLVADIGPFAAARDDSPDSIKALGELLLSADDRVVLAQVGHSPLPAGTVADTVADAVQMIAERLNAPPKVDAKIERLEDRDADAMLRLATMTRPGPFKPRTHVLGAFWGVRERGRLIAMAGERFKLEGYTEVSAVCTHPDARGRGLGAALSWHVAASILARGEHPILHAYATNENAIRLYSRLGFVHRASVKITVLARGVAPNA
jgi:predicted GNAT family acetyltransferase